MSTFVFLLNIKQQQYNNNSTNMYNITTSSVVQKVDTGSGTD